MGPNLLKRHAAAAIAGLALLGFAGLLAGAEPLLGLLSRAERHYRRVVGDRLRAAGVVAYWDFDDVRPQEAVGAGAVVTGGTRLVSGHAGSARSFPPGEHGIIHTSFPLPSLGARYALSAWLRFGEEVPNQQVFQYLTVQDGKLVLKLAGPETLAWPIAIRGRFFHVAVTVDGTTGRAALFVDGAPVGDIPARAPAHPAQMLTFGQQPWSPPPAMALDEVSVWNRPLSPAEVRDLSRLRRSLAGRAAPAGLAKLLLVRQLRDAYRVVLLTADLFNPLLHESRVYAAGLPTYALALSRDDVRAFNEYFNTLAENGITAPGSSKKRRVELLESGRRRTALMELEAGDTGTPERTAKWTFSLEILSDEGETERRVLIRPVEGTPYLLTALAGKLAAECGVRAPPPQLCAVSLNGTFEGIYQSFEDAPARGPRWLADPGQAEALLRALPVFRADVLGEFDRLLAARRRALLSDRKSPFASREISAGFAAQRRRLAELLTDRTERSDAALVQRVGDYVREDLFLGDNPHAWLVVGDLDLSVRRVNGAALSFRSLTPAVLGSDGRLAPRLAGPSPALLEVTIGSGDARRTKELAFSVVPQRRLSVLQVKTGREPQEEGGVPCLLELVGGDDQRTGFLAGRIRLRGNTSLHRAKNQKKYYRIELERPLDVPGVGRTRNLYLTSEWRDVTLMRDRLSYDLFRSFSEPGKPRFAVHAGYVELVLNGDYHGVYLLTDRVDGDLLGFPKKAGGADRPVLYKAVGEHATFSRPVRGAYVQRVPRWQDGEFWGPFDALLGFIGRASPAEFAQRAEQILDVDEVADFELLLLLTANMEGRNYNLLLARGGGPGARFFIVPWDYDMTFHSTAIPSNSLKARLHRDLPGYNRRVAERWRALRADRLSEKRLMERIDALGAELAEAAERNYRRWPPTPGETWESEVLKLRAYVRARLATLDRLLAPERKP
jgi:hypothetical protein